jgi:hypothetical protein
MGGRPDRENPKTENPTGEPYTGGTAFDLVNIAVGRVCFVQHNRDPRPIDSLPTLRASLANGLNPNYCFQSANILRESCVCLGVSGVRKDESRSSDTHRTETTRQDEGTMNGGCWTFSLGCQDAKRFAERSTNPLPIYPQRC